MIAALLLVLAQQPTADTTRTAGRPCTVAIDSIGHEYREVDLGGGKKNSFAGGGVLMHCTGTGSTLAADSIAMYGQLDRIDLVGAVHIRDTALVLDARLAYYHLRDERLEAHNNVVAVNRRTGSVLRGPNLNYFRAAKGVRDTVEMRATGRPTIEYRSATDTGAAAEPYIIVADRVRFKGDDRMWGGGKVTIDRSDFAARGDSVHLDETTGFGVLVGTPSLEGKSGESYTLVGTRIELGLERRDIRRIKALGAGEATGTDWRLTADTIHLHVDHRRLQQAFAWGDSSRPHAVSDLNTIQSDSLALDLPEQVLTEARAYGRAFSTAKRDSAAVAADIDWIAGDTIVAQFVQEREHPDSAGSKLQTRIQRVRAGGAARALTHHFDARDAALPPSINYSRGRSIHITLKQNQVDRVVVGGRADGVQLDPRPPAPPPADTTAKADSTAKPATRPPR